MFNLEQAIVAWREQMLTAGIKTPVPLEELESHLREEIERQIQSGLNPKQAFELAVHKIGRVYVLQTEFSKVDDGEKAGRWERWLAIIIAVGVVIPLGIYGFFKNDMSLGWRLAGFTDLAVICLAVLGCRRINQFFPVLPDKRVRMVIGLTFGLVSLTGIVVFMNFVLPNVELTVGQLTVVVLWALTLMAALGAVWAGLEEAARRQSTTVNS
jgi:peptidoglycan/LPS O-acetylase OafA/YrhL